MNWRFYPGTRTIRIRLHSHELLYTGAFGSIIESRRRTQPGGAARHWDRNRYQWPGSRLPHPLRTRQWKHPPAIEPCSFIHEICAGTSLWATCSRKVC